MNLIKDTLGRTYNLGWFWMREKRASGNYSGLKMSRDQLRKGLESGRAQYWTTGIMFIGSWPTDEIDVSIDGDEYFFIGCRTFSPKAATRLIKWAKT